MSTDIKPGQVRRWNHVPDKSIVIDSVDGVKVTYHQTDGATFTSNAVHLGYATNLVGWDVTPTDVATPAPLDPSKVAPKDRHPEQLARVRKQVHWATDLKRGDLIVSVEAHDAVTVEREAPAPEPLVEGRLYEVTAPDGRRGRAFYKPIDGIRANHPWVSEDETRYRSDAVTDVRPLVVIDPAAARKALEDNGWGEHETNEILHHLRIEAP
jgi:hypothetical protein